MIAFYTMYRCTVYIQAYFAREAWTQLYLVLGFDFLDLYSINTIDV